MPRRGRGKQGTHTEPPGDESNEAASGAVNPENNNDQGTGDPPLQNDETNEFSDLILTSEKRRGVYECDYCHSDISQLPRVRCAQCPDFDLCLDCFATSDHVAVIARLKASTSDENATVLKHDASHGYRVCESTRYPLFPTRSGRSKMRSSISSVAEESTNNNNNNNNSATPATLSVADEGSKKEVQTTTDGAPQETQASPAEPQQKSDSKEIKEMAASPAVEPPAPIESSSSQEKPTPESKQDAEMTDGMPSEPAKVGEKTKDEAEKGVKSEEQDTGTTHAVDAPLPKSEVSSETATPPPTKPPPSEEPTEDGNTSDVILLQASEDPRNVWTVEEDLRLLEGIKTHGLANWTEISEAVSGHGSAGKTSRRCMERYFDDFLGRYGHILPPFVLCPEDTDEEEKPTPVDNQTTETKMEDGSEEEGAVRASKRRAVLMRSPSTFSNTSTLPRRKFKAVPIETEEGYEEVWSRPYLPNDKVQMGQEVMREQMHKAEQTFVRTLASLETKEEVERVRKEWEETKLNQPGGPAVLPMRVEDVITLPGAELQGFMPRRGDFDVEWENEAEQAVADMEFLPGEPEEDRQLKLQVLAIYNNKLEEREKRKQFILSRKLYDYRQRQREDQMLPRDERDLVQRMRLFERFHTPQEHAKFLADILKAKRLRKEIAKLQMYRRIGIRTMLDAERYELDKARHQYHKTAHLQKEAETKKSETGGTSDTAKRSTEETSSMSLWKQYRTSDRKVRRSINRGLPGESSEAVDTEAPGQAMTIEESTDPMQGVEPTEKPVGTEVEKKNGGKSLDNLEVHAGYELLSEREVALCTRTELLPAQYLEIKRTLIQQSLAAGLIEQENNNRTLVKIDVDRRGDVIDFLVRAGWVSPVVGDAARRWNH